MGKAVIGVLLATIAILLVIGLLSSSRPGPAAAQSEVPAGVELLLRYQEGTNRPEAERFVTSLGLSIDRAILGGSVLVARTTPTSPADVRTRLQASGYFAYVEESHTFELPRPVVAPASLAPLVGIRATIDDPYYSWQWNLPKVSAEQAWEITSGSPAATVCVIDSGFAVGHPDQPEHLILGQDYVDGGSVQSDPDGHGTHVTGIIAARTNNGYGIASLAAGVKVVNLRVLDENGLGYYRDFATAIYDGVAEGCRVMNLSLGGETDSKTLKDAVDYAVAHDVLLIAAAGNCGAVSPDCPTANPPHYPAAYEGVMAIGATDYADQRADYSNYGDHISVVAPGSAILSSVPIRDWENDFFAWYSGTSMATPHVAALAGLIWSIRPDLSAADIRTIIETTAVDLGTPGKDPEYGHGRIDAYEALRLAQGYAPAIPTPTATGTPTPTATPTQTATPTPIVSPTPPSTPEPSPSQLPSGLQPVARLPIVINE